MQAISIDYLEQTEYRRAAYARQNPGLREELSRVIAELASAGRRDEFYSSLSNAWGKYGSLTQRQEAALKRSLTQYHDRNERIVASRKARTITQPIPTGRVGITGRVVSTKWVDSQYGETEKMLVESVCGWRVWGTVPQGLKADGVQVGDTVTFIAKVEPKEADFGFFSRPTNARVLRDAQPEVPAVQAEPEPAQPEALEPGDEFEQLLEKPWTREAPQAAAPAPQAAPAAPVAPKLTGLAALVAAAGYK